LPITPKTRPVPKAPLGLMAMDEALSELPEPPRDVGEAHAAMTRVLKSHPDLSYMGFGEGPDPWMFSTEALLMFARSREWFRERRKRPGERGIAADSYNLKNRAGNQIGHVFSGPFIGGAIAEGVRVVRDRRGPNATIFISRRSGMV
jgi:hypothetical protein